LTVDGFPFRKISAHGTIEQNIVGHKANVPLERFSMFGRGRPGPGRGHGDPA
jgi:hypothetical protein